MPTSMGRPYGSRTPQGSISEPGLEPKRLWILGDYHLEIQFPEQIPAEDGTEDPDDPYAPLHGPWTLSFTVP